MFLYFDHVFAEGRDRQVRPLHTIPNTLNRLYLMAMREHDRPAVLMHRDAESWEPTPDWRFDRQVIRLALYLREKASFEVGDRALLIGPLRLEWILADCAVAGLGGISCSIAADLGSDAIRQAVADTGPRVVFVSEDALPSVLGGRNGSPEQLIVFSSPGSRPAYDEGLRPFSSALDLGSTFDTPEKAQAFRATARDTEPDAPALRHYRAAVDGTLLCDELTQAAAVERLRARWGQRPARRGDRIYLADSEATLDARLFLYGFIGDGYSTIVLGSPGHAAEEIAALRPEVIVAPPAVLESILQAPLHRRDVAVNGVRSWIDRLAGWSVAGRERRKRQRILDALGGRVRWIASTGPLAPDTMKDLGSVLGIESNAGPQHGSNREKASTKRV